MKNQDFLENIFLLMLSVGLLQNLKIHNQSKFKLFKV